MKRRRGATFTIIVLLSSALLLTIGGAFVESSRSLVSLAGLRERHEQAREALAGAAAWSRSAVAAGQGSGKTELKLSRVAVQVELKPSGDAVAMDATAHTLDQDLHARALLAQRDGRWVIARFELLDGEGRPTRSPKFR
jgi:hypothetical protein